MLYITKGKSRSAPEGPPSNTGGACALARDETLDNVAAAPVPLMSADDTRLLSLVSSIEALIASSIALVATASGSRRSGRGVSKESIEGGFDDALVADCTDSVDGARRGGRGGGIELPTNASASFEGSAESSSPLRATSIVRGEDGRSGVL